MIGDFLLSRRDERFRGRKKIARIRPNFALGWSGPQLHAEIMLGKLYDDMPLRPRHSDFSRWLESFDLTDLGRSNLKLVGWVVDETGPRSFHWDAGAPFIQWDEPCWFIGSGQDVARNLYDAYIGGSSMMRVPDERDALDWILGSIAHLNANDLIDRTTRQQGFGGGYEALYWSTATCSFQYVETVTYFLIGQVVDGSGEPIGRHRFFENGLASYRTFGECSALTLIATKPEKSSETWLMTAVGIPSSLPAIYHHLMTDRGPIDASAAYYAGLILVASPNATIPPTPLIQCPWDTVQYFRGAPGRLVADLPEQVFRDAYRVRGVPTD